MRKALRRPFKSQRGSEHAAAEPSKSKEKKRVGAAQLRGFVIILEPGNIEILISTPLRLLAAVTAVGQEIWYLTRLQHRRSPLKMSSPCPITMRIRVRIRYPLSPNIRQKSIFHPSDSKSGCYFGQRNGMKEGSLA